MPSRYHSDFPERGLTAPTSAKKTASGDPTPKGAGQRTAAWPTKGVKGAGAFAPRGARVVKTHATRAGLSGGLGSVAYYGKKS